MNKVRLMLLLPLLIAIITNAQQIGKGTPNARRNGIHDGNRVITVFNNYGVIAQPGDIGPAGAWKYRTNKYVGDVSPLVGVRLPYRDYNSDGIIDTLHSVVITDVSRPGGGDYSPGGGDSWTFEPIPGFANPTYDPSQSSKGVAMSHLPETWPNFWPDQPTWVDSNGLADWNGYFGRDQMSADQESYYMMDDDSDKKMFLNYGFIPDTINDQSRRGQGLRMSVRGLQWSDFLAQDVIFWLYQITNVGSTDYDQVTFGTLVGTYVGLPGDEWNDDASFFNIRDNITYTWDYDQYVRPTANPDWVNPHEVGYIAYSFLESPGNKYDGIDNDGDSKEMSSFFAEEDFNPRTLSAGDKLILIDKDTYERTEFIMPSYPVIVNSQGRDYRLVPDSTKLEEGTITAKNDLKSDAYDGYDNDFDGLIDENYQIHYHQYKKDFSGAVLIDTLNPVKYINYLANNGSAYRMIDEARDDNIDNDNDWSKDPELGVPWFNEDGNLLDDVGEDGKNNTNDFGENDGIPTNGEPNFDQTDVNESDQIGLTNFYYFVPGSNITLADENDMWNRLKPGNFLVPSSVRNNVASRGEDGDFIYGSGYFRILAGATERYSLAFSFGDDFNAVIKTKKIAQFIYDANYNFPRPPDQPTLKAVAGDGKVTLYWDKVAEKSIDPVTKEKDFEGYFIYKATDPNFTDIMKITNRDGNPMRLKPMAQFDLDNGIQGLFPTPWDLNETRMGVPFYLGDDTGIQNTFVDEDVKNGVTYFYAVSAYDRGTAAKNIFPAENSHYISVDTYGNYSPGSNCAVVVPNAPVAGYEPPLNGQALTRVEGSSTSIPYYNVVDPSTVIDAEYEVTFIDSLVDFMPIAYAYNVENLTSSNMIYNKNLDFRSNNNDVFNGVTLNFDVRYQTPDSIKLDINNTAWNSEDEANLRYAVQPFDFVGYPKGIKEIGNYAIVFYDEYDKETTPNLLGLPLPLRLTNFEIFNISNPDIVNKLPFAFITLDSTLSKGDRLFLANSDTSKFTWTIEFLGDNKRVPVYGDTLFITVLKPISSADKFVFNTYASTISKEIMENQIDKIKVVPNPYIVSNIFEHPLPSEIRGRGERIIKFIHLPADSKISIYTSAGNLVRTLHHEGNLNDGSVAWDLRTVEGLDVAYGIYFYVVEIPTSDKKKFGKIALIK
jgi:hypothetical protein